MPWCTKTSRHANCTPKCLTFQSWTCTKCCAGPPCAGWMSPGPCIATRMWSSSGGTHSGVTGCQVQGHSWHGPCCALGLLHSWKSDTQQTTGEQLRFDRVSGTRPLTVWSMLCLNLQHTCQVTKQEVNNWSVRPTDSSSRNKMLQFLACCFTHCDTAASDNWTSGARLSWHCLPRVLHPPCSCYSKPQFLMHGESYNDQEAQVC